MGRNYENGLHFFSFDTDFFEDKTVKVLKAKYGADGIAVYLYILCLVYKRGFYAKRDDDFEYVIAADLNMSQEKIGQIINFLCKRSLLSGKLLASDKVLTSHGIQSRYQKMMKSRNLNREILVNEKYWVLNERETEPFIKFTQNKISSEEMRINSEEMKINSEEITLKERKGKESILKENIQKKKLPLKVTIVDDRPIEEALEEEGLSLEFYETMVRLHPDSPHWQQQLLKRRGEVS